MRSALFALAISLTACLPYTPPAPPKPRSAMLVPAPFDRTWDAVIDVFAREVITIETMERASGFIVASREGIANRTRSDSIAILALADCGKGGEGFTNVVSPFLPSSAKYNVLVRSAGESSTVQVTLKFVRVGVKGTSECTSTGRFEEKFESLVKSAAVTPR